MILNEFAYLNQNILEAKFIPRNIFLKGEYYIRDEIQLMGLISVSKRKLGVAGEKEVLYTQKGSRKGNPKRTQRENWV